MQPSRLLSACRHIGFALCAAWAAAAAAQPADEALRVVATPRGREVAAALLRDAPPPQGGSASEPQVASASTSEAAQAFCRRDNPADAIVLSRRIDDAAALCAANGLGEYAAIRIGISPVVLAVRADASLPGLAAAQVYLALARDIPVGDEFRRNASIRWADIDRALPPTDIRFQLPPRDTSLREVFETWLMTGGCRGVPAVAAIGEADQRTARCVTVRGDRVREVARDQAVRALLEAPAGTVGVVALSDLERAGGALRAIPIDGVAPTAAAVREGDYPFATSYWLYVRDRPSTATRPAATVAAAKRLAERALADAATGQDGIVSRLGLVPLSDADRERQRQAMAARDEPYGVDWLVSWVAWALRGAWELAGLWVSEDEPVGSAQPRTDFSSLMSVAGFKLKEIDSTIGLVPGAGMSFASVRDMSEADRRYLDRLMDRDARARPGPVAALQRQLVRAVIDKGESGELHVKSVDVTLFPLPSVKFLMGPSGGGGGGSDQAGVQRALERLQERLPEVFR